MAEKRKLAAVLAADVVGFSRLTSADEDRTLARLRALRSDLIYPTIAVNNGRVIKRCSQLEVGNKGRDGVWVTLRGLAS
jgi:adenylate cyclase